MYDARCKVWILKLGDLPGLDAIRIFLLFAAVLVPISIIADAPVITPLIFAYALAITNYLVDRQSRELRNLRSILVIDEAQFEQFVDSMSLHNKSHLNLAWLIGPMIMVAINYYGPDIAAIRNGATPDAGTIYGLALAMLFWITMCQMVVIFMSNAIAFWKLGTYYTTIDLLEVQSLTPFARVATRNILIFVGGWSLIPIALAEDMDYLRPVLTAFFLTLPIAITLLVLPMFSIRQRVVTEKEAELHRVQSAIHGDRAALSESPIAQDADTITMSNLVLYHSMVEGINEWPVDYTVVVRLVVYVVIPLLAWVGSALVSAIVDKFV